MGWHGRLDLRYRRDGERTVVHDRHRGPLRVLASLYPEAPGICHNVIVHPPGGIVGGDVLEVDAELGEGTHALITTPGATRFYRSAGQPAVQDVRIRAAAGARMEWLPLETLYHSGCLAENRLVLSLAPGAELIGWDIAALGLPQARQPFVQGEVLQHLELQGAWLERARIAAADTRLLDGPLGMAGHRCLATLFFAAGSELSPGRREQLLDTARAVIADHPLSHTAGATAPDPRVVVVRVLAGLVEPALHLLKAVRMAWREESWGLRGAQPRGWEL